MTRRHITLLLSLTSVVSAQIPAEASQQMQMDQMPKKPKPAPLNKDLPYIRCQTCQLMATAFLTSTKTLIDAAGPASPKKRRFDSSSNLGGAESAVEDLVSNICNSEDKEGSWITDYDIVKKGSELKLENQVNEEIAGGHCRRECRTIEKACVGVLESVDSDLPEVAMKAVREQTSPSTFSQRVCTKMAGVCKKGKTPTWPAGKVRKNEEFKPKTVKDKETEELMASLRNMPGMEGQGLSMMSGSDLDLGDEEEALKDEI